ncbi:MAG: S49 family peptidase [Methylovulum sp.]|nr:S49 family peptidase [Methylovulum sp.]
MPTPIKNQRILVAIQSSEWAITSEAMQTIIAIAQGMGDPEALQTKLGQPLGNTRIVNVRDGIALVPVTGPIFRYANLFTEVSGATSLSSVATDFQEAVDNPDVKAIINVYDTPGGMINGISEHGSQVLAAREIKPVYGFVSNRAQSAGYWLASACQDIICADTALLGSIGAMMQLGVDEESGTITIISDQSPFKNADPTTEAGRKQYQQITNALAQVFIDTIAANRGVSVDHVLTHFGRGGSLIAADAIKAGMADRLGTLEGLIAELKSKRTLNPPKKLGPTAMTKDELMQQHPDLVKAIADESHTAGVAVGRQQERERIQGIEGLAMPGHDALIAQLKFDGITTAEQAAVKILHAEKQTREQMANDYRDDAPRPLPAPNAPLSGDDQPEAKEKLTGEAKWAADYAASATLQEEYGSQDNYVAYMKAVESGRIKQKKG